MTKPWTHTHRTPHYQPKRHPQKVHNPVDTVGIVLAVLCVVGAVALFVESIVRLLLH